LTLRPGRIAIAVFIAAAIAMFVNEARLERERPRAPEPGHNQRITFKDAGGLRAMFISPEDQNVRLGLTAIIITALMVCVWLERRGR
jgi:hypothetical protein